MRKAAENSPTSLFSSHIAQPCTWSILMRNDHKDLERISGNSAASRTACSLLALGGFEAMSVQPEINKAPYSQNNWRDRQAKATRGAFHKNQPVPCQTDSLKAAFLQRPYIWNGLVLEPKIQCIQRLKDRSTAVIPTATGLLCPSGASAKSFESAISSPANPDQPKNKRCSKDFLPAIWIDHDIAYNNAL